MLKLLITEKNQGTSLVEEMFSVLPHCKLLKSQWKHLISVCWNMADHGAEISMETENFDISQIIRLQVIMMRHFTSMIPRVYVVFVYSEHDTRC